MKILKLLTYLLILPTSVSYGQTLNTSFFNRLKSRQVTSNPDFEWRQFGPGMAGYCEEFWVHPTDPDCYFMAPDLSNTYGSYDNAESWITIKGRDNNGSNLRRVQVIEFSHQDPNFGHAIDVTGRLYTTSDKGRNWSTVTNLNEGRHSELAVDPSNDNNWYIGAGDFWNVKSYHKSRIGSRPEGSRFNFIAYGHIYRTTNKGATWTPVVVDPAHANDLSIGVIIVDPENSRNLIAATNFGLYRSTNQGVSWTAAPSSDLPNNYPRDLTVHYDNSDPSNPVTTLIYLEQTSYVPNGNTIDSVGGVYTSTNFGASWTNVTGNLGIAIGSTGSRDRTPGVDSATTANQYFKTVALWLGISDNQAKNTYTNLPNNAIPTFNRVVVNPNNVNEIYISQNVKHDKGFGPGEVWKTENGGVNWFPCARYGSYWDSNNDHSYWNTTRSNAFVPDSNTTFAHLQPDINRKTETAGNRFLEINQNGDVFICLEQQVFRSNNGGQSWQQIDDIETSPGSKKWIGRGDSNLPGRFLLLDTGVPGRVLACSGEHGLWQTVSHSDYAAADDLTVAVQQIEGQVNRGGSHSIATVAVDPNDPNTIFTLQFRQEHRGQLRKSTNGGATWSTVATDNSANLVFDEDYSGTNESQDHFFQYNLLINPNNTQRMFFVAPENAEAEVSTQRGTVKGSDLGVRYTFDGGATWDTGVFPASATPRSIRRIAMHPATPNVMYAASNVSSQGVLGGLFRSANSGRNWGRVSIPSEIKSVNNVFLDKNPNTAGFHDIFISCGQFKSNNALEGGVWKSSDDGATWNKIFDMPYVWQTEVSPVTPNIITVSVALQDFKTRRNHVTVFNPGIYVSYDGGSTWEKANNNIGQPNTVTDIKPDIEDPRIFWTAIKGSGWAKGIFRGSNPTLSINTIDSPLVETTKTLEVYPIPAKDQLTLSSSVINLGEQTTIEIFSLEGKLISRFSGNQGEVNTKKLDLKVSNLNTGTYLLRVLSNKRTYIKRFIKE